jgi:serine/threonine protein kinase
MHLVDQDEEFPNIPPLNRFRALGGGGVPPAWKDMPLKDTVEDTRLCDKIYDKDNNWRKRPNPRKIQLCSYGSACRFAHNWKSKLRVPFGYTLNSQPVTDLPMKFEATDWGSGHADAPRFTFAIHETYPTKPTRFLLDVCVPGGETLQKYVHENTIQQKMVPKGNWTYIGGLSLCYHFTFKDLKCPYWFNCEFLHVTPAALDREFKQYRCKCGQNDGLCRYASTCKYVHNLRDLRHPEEFLQSGFPGLETLRHLLFLDETGAENAISVPAKYIAETFRKDSSMLCSDPWCCYKTCGHGVHLIPDTWIDEAFVGDKPPAPPVYFQNRIRTIRAKSKATPKAKTRQAIPKAPAASVSEVTAVEYLSPPLHQPEAVPDIFLHTGSVSSTSDIRMPPARRPPGPPPGPPPKYSPAKPVVLEEMSPGDSSTTETLAVETECDVASQYAWFEVIEPPHLTRAQSIAADSSQYFEAYESMLTVPPPPLWPDPDTPEAQKRKKAMEGYILDEKQTDILRTRWNGGLSKRFEQHYRDWLDSGEFNNEFLKEGHVYYHTHLKIGKGCAAEVFLGLIPSDGREVAVKVFGDHDDFSRAHFKNDVASMKEQSSVPGTLHYLTSFENSYFHRGNEKNERVVVLELMEGSLKDAMINWKNISPNPIGTLSHLQVIRCVGGSLLHTLSKLANGSKRDLVHRDIKPDNIMIDYNLCIRLGDFGISNILEKQQPYAYAGPEEFASPEARAGRTKAHRTSDLYSLGKVMLAMILDLDSKGRALLLKDVDQMSHSWPQHHWHAYKDLVQALLEFDEHRRAYNHLISDVLPHRLVLSHPFFWSSRTCTRFLVTLGSYQFPPPFGEHLPNAIQEAIREAPEYMEGMTWFDFVQDLEQSKYPTEPEYKTSPFGLLKFIRSKLIHLHDRSMDKDVRKILVDQPAFLQRFPTLVMCCWKKLLEALPQIRDKTCMQHVQLREFFDRPFEVESVRSGFTDEPWQWL